MTMPDAGRVCLLPGGYRDARGVLHCEAEVAPLTGREEELLAGTRGAPAPELVTAVLCRAVRRIGAVSPVTPEVARALLVADRLFLLLRVRAATFGERVEGTLECPWPRCGARVDVDFSLADVPVKRCAEPLPTYVAELSAEAAAEDGAGAAPRAVEFRLPRGDDQEALAGVLAENPARALTALLERCLVATGEGAVAVDRLSPRARAEVEAAMAAVAPHVELEMDLACPECGRAFTAPFDPADFLFGELRTSRGLLYRQVHYLAWHYHWSEGEILDLPRDKRLAYIEILADEIEALNHAV
jgi:hypothetical protein